MAIETSYINFSDLNSESTMSAKLYIDQYDATQLANAIDIKVTELITGLPTASLDLVPKPVYDAEVSHSADLQLQVNILTTDNDALKSRVQSLLADSSSLYTDNDSLRVAAAKLQNTIDSVQQTTLELRTNLTTSLTKAINEATERTALEAENAGLTAQKNALIKQIDTLNNLLAQANATIQVAQQQLSAKQQAVAAGGVSTGELSTIVFSNGDPTKLIQQGVMISQDYGGGYGSNAKAGQFAASGNPFASTYQTYFDVVAGPKDISVNISFKGDVLQSPWNLGVSLPVQLKANQTQRFQMDSPSAYLNQLPGQNGGGLFSHSSPTQLNYTMTITATDIDPNGKIENKDFVMRIYNHN